MNSTYQQRASITFGRFAVLPERRDLLASGQPIKLGGRAFDVLMALIEAPGAVIGKDALMARAWPNRIVGEDNLTAQIVALRRALGSDRGLIRTVSGRGYQFVGETRRLAATTTGKARDVTAATAAEVIQPPTNLPEQVTELIGREQELAEVWDLLATHRFVSLTGPGGIGKTRLALAAARQLLTAFAEGVWLVELSAIASPALVATSVAAAVGLQLGAEEISPLRVSQALAHRRLLLILDTCEHVIDAAAAMAEALVRGGAEVRIIATSREPLRAEGEQIYQVPSLSVPVVGQDPWRSDAVRLFVVRSQGRGVHVAEDLRVAPTIADICRRLDGIPLAIELAAARAATLGVEALAARLDDRFGFLAGGRRTALPRHQTLRATLDWSYELLSERERVILRRLAVFAGPFRVEAASTVAAARELAPLDVVDGLSNLVAKSLVVAEVKGTAARYRLLDTMRAYALEKLRASGGEDRLLLRLHAEFYRDLFERAEAERGARPTAEWLEDYAWCIGNVRAALDWAFSSTGDTSIGVALVTAAVPLWIALSLLGEGRSRVEQALAVCDSSDANDRHREMKLYSALLITYVWGSGGLHSQADKRKLVAFGEKRLAAAESLGDILHQLRSLWGLCTVHFQVEQYHTSFKTAERLYALAAQHQQRTFEVAGERLMGLAQHALGDQTSARRHTERALALSIASGPRRRGYIGIDTDQDLWGGAALASVLWLQGFPDQAVRTVERLVDGARENNFSITLVRLLVNAAFPVALWVGDLTAAERYNAMVLEHSARLALPSWDIRGRILESLCMTMRVHSDHNLRQLRATLDASTAVPAKSYIGYLNELAAGFARAGRVTEGLAAVEQAMERAERTGARWQFVESLRIRGELLLLQARVATAEDHFRRALDLAHRQGALSFELRAATNLARLLRDQSRSADAKLLLQPVYDRFTEGFGTADLRAAKTLLETLE